MRCRFTVFNDAVQAMTMYGGKEVNAYSYCNTKVDTFDESVGKKIAEKKLTVKVCCKREKYYAKQVEELTNEMHELSKKLARIAKKYSKAVIEKLAAEEDLDDYMGEINS